MSKPKSVSSKDVAREAGVSQATVSYVLNNVEGIKIKHETREAVLNAAKKLNYHPNLIARSMKIKKSMSIGIVTDKSISSLMFMNVLEGIKDAILTKNYSITLCLNKAQDLNDAEYIKYYNSNRIDGIIFAYANLTDEQIAYLIDYGVPFVIIDTNIKGELIHLVKTDMKNAIADAIGYLKQKGINEIGFIGVNANDKTSSRYQGYIEGLKSYGVPFDERFVHKISNPEQDIESEIHNYFKNLGQIPRAILCDRTNYCFQILRYAAETGIRVPSQMSVIVIGTSQFSAYTYPSLSAIEAPLYDIGYTGGEMLFNIMDSKVSEDVVVLQWKFVPRDSS